MIKKIAFTLLSAVFSALTFAGSMGPVSAVRPYSLVLGIDVGMSMLQGTYQAFNPTLISSYSNRLGNENLLTGGVFGIQTLYPNHLYLALLGNVQYNSQEAIQRQGTGFTVPPVFNHIVSLENSLQYGLNLRVGANMNNVTPYLTGGFEVGDWGLGLGNQDVVYTAGVAPLTDWQYFRNLIGGQAGAGVLVNFNPNWTIGMEYAHTWFGSNTVNLNDPITGIWNHKAKIAQDQVLFSINYAFNI